MLKGEVVPAVCSALELDIWLAPVRRVTAQIPPPPPPASFLSPRRSPTNLTADDSEDSVLTPGDSCVDAMGRSIAARAALATSLQLIHSPPSYLNLGWRVFWFLLAALRDSVLLPREMVLDADADLLPLQVRLDFAERLEILAAGGKKEKKVKPPRKVATILSFQGLGEALFGGMSSDEEEEEDHSPLIHRWDLGYETDWNHSEEVEEEIDWASSSISSIRYY